MYVFRPKLIALTTTHGNVGEEQVFNNTQRILSVADRRDVSTVNLLFTSRVANKHTVIQEITKTCFI